MIIFTALLPVIGWGVMPIVANIKRVSTYQQLLGVSISAVFFAVFFTMATKPIFTCVSFLISIISGIFWSFGQFYQFKAIKQSSVSKAMPVSNGSQLIITALLGVVIFQEWNKVSHYFIGIISIFMITIGIIATSFSEEKGKGLNSAALFSILLSSAFLALYVLTNKIFKIDNDAIFLPQSIGMISSSFLFYWKKDRSPLQFQSFIFPILSGVAWAIANVGMFMTNDRLGVSLGYAISQCCVIVSTIGGILIFREYKSKKEWKYIIIGMALILIGIVGLSSI